MYEMIDAGISGNISQEDFVKRNSAIYEGIDVDNMKVHITSYDKEQKEICYETSMDTVEGNVTFENKASFILEKGKYKLIWNDSLIFPELDSTDKVKVSTTSAKRGQIIDRNGHLLAGEGVASSIGVVPGKLENKNDAISQLAELLEMKTEDIEKKLAAKWVKERQTGEIIRDSRCENFRYHCKGISTGGGCRTFSGICSKRYSRRSRRT